MRPKDDETYQEYKDDVENEFLLWIHNEFTVEECTDSLVESYENTLYGTPALLWIVALARYEIEHNIVEPRVQTEVSFYIYRYEIGKYPDVTPEEKVELEADIEFVRNNLELVDKSQFDLEEEETEENSYY